MTFKSVKVATPFASVVAVVVPARAGESCNPDGVGEVPSAAVTVTPDVGVPPVVRVTAGWVPSTAPI